MLSLLHVLLYPGLLAGGDRTGETQQDNSDFRERV